MKTVAAGDEVAADAVILAPVTESDLRLAAVEIMHADRFNFEHNLPTIGEPPRDQILHDLLLAVDGDALADELAEVDVMQLVVEAKMDAVVEQALSA